MDNLKKHTREIDGDFISYYFAQYMQGEWGIEVGYQTLPAWWINYRKQLADWQNLQDCCSLCAESKLPKPMIVNRYAVLNPVPDPCSPFTPLNPGPTYYVACTYTGKGDYNRDFNFDLFK